MSVFRCRPVVVATLLAMSLVSMPCALGADATWERRVNGGIGVFNLTVGGDIVVQTKTGLVAVTLDEGAPRWTRADIDEIDVLAGGRFGVARAGGKRVVIDLLSGDNRWDAAARQCAVKGYASAGTPNELLVYGETPHRPHMLMLLRMDTGDERWRQDARYGGAIPPAVVRGERLARRQPVLPAGDLLIVDAAEGGLLALNRQSGLLAWRVDRRLIGEPADVTKGSGRMLADATRLYVPNGNTVTAVSLATGTVVWTGPKFPRPIAQMETTPAGLLVRGAYQLKKHKPSWHPYVALLDPASGRVRWSTEQGAETFDGRSSFLVKDDLVIVGLRKGLLSLDLATGTPRARVPMRALRGDEDPCCVEALSGNRFLITSSQNARLVDLEGRTYYDVYWHPAGTSLLSKIALIGLIGAGMAVGFAGSVPDPLFETFTGTVSTPPYWFVLTDERDQAGRDGISLVRVDKETGRDTGRVWFTRRPPRFLLARGGCVVVIADGDRLSVSRFPGACAEPGVPGRLAELANRNSESGCNHP
jgi:outer membrane protein assembly factor BamB